MRKMWHYVLCDIGNNLIVSMTGCVLSFAAASSTFFNREISSDHWEEGRCPEKCRISFFSPTRMQETGRTRWKQNHLPTKTLLIQPPTTLSVHLFWYIQPEARVSLKYPLHRPFIFGATLPISVHLCKLFLSKASTTIGRILVATFRAVDETVLNT